MAVLNRNGGWNNTTGVITFCVRVLQASAIIPFWRDLFLWAENVARELPSVRYVQFALRIQFVISETQFRHLQVQTEENHIRSDPRYSVSLSRVELGTSLIPSEQYR